MKNSEKLKINLKNTFQKNQLNRKYKNAKKKKKNKDKN